MDFDQDASPAAEDKRLNLWARMFSKEVGRNLCPYFSWFGWLLSSETWEECHKLPRWQEGQGALERFDYDLVYVDKE